MGTLNRGLIDVAARTCAFSGTEGAAAPGRTSCSHCCADRTCEQIESAAGHGALVNIFMGSACDVLLLSAETEDEPSEVG